MLALGMGERDRNAEPSTSRSSRVGDEGCVGLLALTLKSATSAAADGGAFNAALDGADGPEDEADALLALALEAGAGTFAFRTPPELSLAVDIQSKWSETRTDWKFTDVQQTCLSSHWDGSVFVNNARSAEGNRVIRSIPPR